MTTICYHCGKKLSYYEWLNKIDTCHDCKEKDKASMLLKWLEEHEINLDGTYFVNTDWLRKWLKENSI